MKAWWMLLAVLPVGAVAAPVVQDFVPQGWKLERQADGDLNGDGRADKVLVLQQQDAAHWQDNPGLGAPRLNLNPRTLLVLWNTPQGYREAVRNTTLLPSENSEDTPCLADPLDDGGISIRKQVLVVDLHYWLSCGSYSVNHMQYKFRHQQGAWPLIGLDVNSSARNMDDTEQSSYNFATGKALYTGVKTQTTASGDSKVVRLSKPSRISNPRVDLRQSGVEAKLGQWLERNAL